MVSYEGHILRATRIDHVGRGQNNCEFFDFSAERFGVRFIIAACSVWYESKTSRLTNPYDDDIIQTFFTT